MRKWLKKLQIKGFVAGVLFTAMLSGTLLVVANPGGVMRELFYGVNIVVNGVPQNFPDDMAPFITGGRTFLPVRGIADVFDVPTDWDGATRTVYIGTMPHGAPFWSTVPFFERSSTQIDVGTVYMLGQPYANAIRSTSGSGAVSGCWSHHNLNGQFSTITGMLGRADGSGTLSSTISFIGDGRELASFTVDGNSVPTEISIDVQGVLVLRIQIEQNTLGPSPRARIAFVNATIE